MKSKIIYVLSLFVCFLLGLGAMGVIIQYYPSSDKKITTTTKVEITDTGISSSVEKIDKSVVVIESYSNNKLVSTGTGFVYEEGEDVAYILTNHHVIEKASSIKITYSDDSVTYATKVGSDEYADIAVLSVPKETILSVATMGSSSNVKVGDLVFTIGSPMGIEFKGTVTKGILSGKDRLISVSVSGDQNDWIMNVMQTDAAINPGNSGGPLCNANGEVIGINSLKIVRDTIEGIGFAIPIEDAVSYAHSLREYGKIIRPYIGVTMINASNTRQLSYVGVKIDSSIKSGVAVIEVESDSPSDKAGLQKGDVIIKVGPHEVDDIAEFRFRLYSYDPGESVELVIKRGTKEQTVNIILESN